MYLSIRAIILHFWGIDECLLSGSTQFLYAGLELTKAPHTSHLNITKRSLYNGAPGQVGNCHSVAEMWQRASKAERVRVRSKIKLQIKRSVILNYKESLFQGMRQEQSVCGSNNELASDLN